MKPQERKITYQEVVGQWGYSAALSYLVELLNGEYQVEELRSDILGLISTQHAV